MKKIQDINYETLKLDLQNIEEKFETLNIKVDITDYFNQVCYTGKRDSKYYMVSSDVQRLTKQLIYYFYTTIKNFHFIDLYDKEFIESFKALIKEESEFNLFLNMTGFDLDDFLYLGVYVCPNAFTSTLIKFIQSNYLKIKVAKKKRTKK